MNQKQILAVIFSLWFVFIVSHYYTIPNNLAKLSLSILFLGLLLYIIYVLIKTIYNKHHNKYPKIRTTVIILLIACIFIAISYYLLPKHIFQLSYSLLLLVWLTCIAYAIGNFIYNKIHHKESDYTNKIEIGIFSITLGFGTMGYAIFALASLHLINKVLCFGILIVLTLMIIYSILRNRAKNKLPSKDSVINGTYSSIDYLLIAFIVSIAIFNLLSALAPEIEYDSLVYHLALPKIYVLHHGFFNILSMPHDGFPQLIEMFYTLALALNNEILAKLIHFAFGLLMVGATYSLGNRYFSKLIGLLAAAIFYSMPIIEFESSVAYIDLGFGLFGLLGIYALVNWASTRKNSWLWISAIMIGFSMGSKYNGCFLLFACLVSLIVILFKRHISAKSIFYTVSVYLIISSLIVFPWLAKNIIYTGNPVYPFLNNIFHSTYWFFENPQFDRALFGVGNNYFTKLVLSIWYMNFDGNSYAGLIGPFILAGVPFCLIYLRKNQLLKYFLFISSIFYIVWVLSVPIIRYFIPILPILAVCAAYAYVHTLEFCNVKGYLKSVVITLFLLVLFYNHPIFSSSWFDKGVTGLPNSVLPIKVILGLETDQKYLTNNLKGYATIQYANGNLPSDAKVLFIQTQQGITDRYHLDRDTVWEWSPEGMPVRTANSANEAFLSLQKNRITHIMLDRTLLPPPLFESDSDLTNNYLNLLHSENNVLLYEVRKSPNYGGEKIFYDFLSKGVSQGFVKPLDTWGNTAPSPRYMTVDMDGDSRGAFVQIAPSQIDFNLTLPRNPMLRFALGMPFKIGDGVIAKVDITYNGKEDEILSCYVDPPSKSDGTKWQDVNLDLTKYAGKTIKITFIADPGPARDTNGDWIVWSDMRIIGFE